MADQIAKGEEFEKQAEKKLTGWAFFGSKHEDAADLFEKAANFYKLGKSCKFSMPSPTNNLIVIDSIEFIVLLISFFVLILMYIKFHLNDLCSLRFVGSIFVLI